MRTHPDFPMFTRSIVGGFESDWDCLNPSGGIICYVQKRGDFWSLKNVGALEIPFDTPEEAMAYALLMGYTHD